MAYLAHGAVGIIPARAGSRVRPVSLPMTFGDHPRACGEQEDIRRDARTVRGSSPRVRGAVALVVGQGLGVGIIPARAGSRTGPRP